MGRLTQYIWGLSWEPVLWATPWFTRAKIRSEARRGVYLNRTEIYDHSGAGSDARENPFPLLGFFGLDIDLSVSWMTGLLITDQCVMTSLCRTTTLSHQNR